MNALSIEKIGKAPMPPMPVMPPDLLRILLPLGFGPLFALIAVTDRVPARVWATFALIASKTDYFGPKTANLGPDLLPRLPT